MEGWRKNGIQAPLTLYWTQRYNEPHYIGVTVYVLKSISALVTNTVDLKDFNKFERGSQKDHCEVPYKSALQFRCHVKQIFDNKQPQRAI